MASLTLFQVLELDSKSREHPTISSISGDALTLVVASTLNVVHVYVRESVSEKFVKRHQIYDKHSPAETITALSIQDSGVHAASGDASGAIHIWRTDDPKDYAKYKFNRGRITAISITTKFILACFTEDPTKKKIILLNKGLNIKERMVVEREFEGDQSSDQCSLSEYGKHASPFLMYIYDGNLVFDCPLHKNNETKKKLLPQDVIPWCIRRNKGAANIFVVSVASLTDLILWAPLNHEGNENPVRLKMSSEESLRINRSLVMSSVVCSTMFMASIYEEKLNVLRVVRKKCDAPDCTETMSNPNAEPVRNSKENLSEDQDRTKESGDNSNEYERYCPTNKSEISVISGIPTTGPGPQEIEASMNSHQLEENVSPGKFEDEKICETTEVKAKPNVEQDTERLTEVEKSGFGNGDVEKQSAFNEDFDDMSNLESVTSHRFWDLFYEDNKTRD